MCFCDKTSFDGAYHAVYCLLLNKSGPKPIYKLKKNELIKKLNIPDYEFIRGNSASKLSGYYFSAGCWILQTVLVLVKICKVGLHSTKSGHNSVRFKHLNHVLNSPIRIKMLKSSWATSSMFEACIKWKGNNSSWFRHRSFYRTKNILFYQSFCSCTLSMRALRGMLLHSCNHTGTWFGKQPFFCPDYTDVIRQAHL